MSLAMLMRAAEFVESEDQHGDSVVPQYSPEYDRRHHPYQRRHTSPLGTFSSSTSPSTSYTYSPYRPTDHGAAESSLYYGGGVPAMGKKESDDDDVTDDDCVPDAVTRPGAPSRKAHAGDSANAHNEVEKRRRAFLATCYRDLHQILPTIAGTKASNANILRCAHEHIKALEREEKMLLAGKKQQLHMREQILARRARVASMVMRHQAVTHQSPPGTVPSDEAVTDEDDTAMVPDNASRPVSPNMSPKEDLTQLASPLRKAKQMAKPVVGGSGGPIRRAGRNRGTVRVLVN